MSATKKPNILFVHSYYFGMSGEDTEVYNRNVREYIRQHWQEYDYIVLLSGDLNHHVRIATETMNYLRSCGVPIEKFITRDSLLLTANEPLDTWQEVQIAKTIMEQLWRNCKAYAVVANWHWFRTHLIYSNYAIRCKVVGVSCPVPWQRFFYESLAVILTICDKRGNSLVVSLNRKRRSKIAY